MAGDIDLVKLFPLDTNKMRFIIEITTIIFQYLSYGSISYPVPKNIRASIS
jgi:hypothetical protein